jgi:hypothetical protein
MSTLARTTLDVLAILPLAVAFGCESRQAIQTTAEERAAAYILGLKAPVDIVHAESYVEGGATGLIFQDSRSKPLEAGFDRMTLQPPRMFVGSLRPHLRYSRVLEPGSKEEQAVLELIRCWLERETRTNPTKESRRVRIATLERTLLWYTRRPSSVYGLREELELPAPNSDLLHPTGDFTLLVSSESSAIDPIDVRIEIDGSLVVSDYIFAGDHHTYIPFRLSLPRGDHRIRISSVKGGAELSARFNLSDQDVGVATYWYRPDSHYNPTPRKFDFRVQRGPPVTI